MKHDEELTKDSAEKVLSNIEKMKEFYSKKEKEKPYESTFTNDDKMKHHIKETKKNEFAFTPPTEEEKRNKWKVDAEKKAEIEKNKFFEAEI